MGKEGKTVECGTIWSKQTQSKFATHVAQQACPAHASAFLFFATVPLGTLQQAQGIDCNTNGHCKRQGAPVVTPVESSRDQEARNSAIARGAQEIGLPSYG